MRVAVTGTGLLAETYRKGAASRVDVTDSNPDLVWVCHDTPVKDDQPILSTLFEWIEEDLERFDCDLFLVSSQIPVGTCRILEQLNPGRRFVVNPENIRRRQADYDFCYPGRHIIGARQREPLVKELLGWWTSQLIWMLPEEAEMVKHTINGFLATAIAFGMEIADLCEQLGVDASVVAAGAISDRRVCEYIRPLGPYTGGTLGRDLHVLNELGGGTLLRAVEESNRGRL